MRTRVDRLSSPKPRAPRAQPAPPAATRPLARHQDAMLPAAAKRSAAPTDVEARFAAVARSRAIGVPMDNGGGLAPHPWLGLWVQDFTGGPDSAHRPCMVVDGPAGPKLLRGGFRDVYLGGNAAKLGAPLDDERLENGIVVQNFERGRMRWQPGAAVTVEGPTRPSPLPGTAAQRLAAYAQAHALGPPFDNGGGAAAHAWLGMTVQDFTVGPSMVIDGPNGAAQVRPPFREAYLAGNAARLGPPTSDEQRVGGVRTQRFAKGTMSLLPSGEVRVSLSGPGPAPSPSSSVYAPYTVAPGAVVNGRLGVHWLSTVADADLTRANAVIAKMKALGAGYCTLLADPARPEAMKPVIDALLRAGITPVVRLYVSSPPDTWSPNDIAQQATAAQKLAAMGVKMIQVGNEPNLEGRLAERGLVSPAQREQYVRQSTANLAQTMLAIRRAAGSTVSIGVTPVPGGAPDKPDWGTFEAASYFPALVREIAVRERASGLRIADWLAVHPYTFPVGHGARSLLGDGPRTAHWFEQTAASALGRPLKALATEGGAVPADFEPPGSPANVTAVLREGLEQLKADPNTTQCLWLLYGPDWQKHALWDAPGNFGAALDEYRRAFSP